MGIDGFGHANRSWVATDPLRWLRALVCCLHLSSPALQLHMRARVTNTEKAPDLGSCWWAPAVSDGMK